MSRGTEEKFLIRINNEPTEMSLEEYTKNVNESIQSNSNFQLTGSNSTVLANNPASSVTGILKEGGGKDLQVFDEWTIKDGKVYRIVFYSDPSKADSFEPIVQKILESFSITK
jgi:methylglyoxal synthase